MGLEIGKGYWMVRGELQHERVSCARVATGSFTSCYHNAMRDNVGDTRCARDLQSKVEGGTAIEAVIVWIPPEAARNNAGTYRAVNRQETRQTSIAEVEQRCTLAASHET